MFQVRGRRAELGISRHVVGALEESTDVQEQLRNQFLVEVPECPGRLIAKPDRYSAAGHVIARLVYFGGHLFSGLHISFAVGNQQRCLRSFCALIAHGLRTHSVWIAHLKTKHFKHLNLFPLIAIENVIIYILIMKTFTILRQSAKTIILISEILY